MPLHEFARGLFNKDRVVFGLGLNLSELFGAWYEPRVIPVVSLISSGWPLPESMRPISLEGEFSRTEPGLLPEVIVSASVLSIAYTAGFDPPRIFYFSGTLR